MSVSWRLIGALSVRGAVIAPQALVTAGGGKIIGGGGAIRLNLTDWSPVVLKTMMLMKETEYK